MGEQPFGRVRLIEMVVESVRVHMLFSQHVVILKESERDRYLPIRIGPAEANAIAMRLQGLTAERPLTHDLLVSAVAALPAKVSRVVVTHVTDGTFHARLYLETADGSETEIDSRTSDAIAVAVRTGSTIYVDERVLDEAGVMPVRERLVVDEHDEKLAVFREFVNSLDVDLGTGEVAVGRGGGRQLAPRLLCEPADRRSGSVGSPPGMIELTLPGPAEWPYPALPGPRATLTPSRRWRNASSRRGGTSGSAPGRRWSWSSARSAFSMLAQYIGDVASLATSGASRPWPC